MKQYLLTGTFPKDAAADERIVSSIVRTTAVNLRKMFQDCGSFSEAVRKELLSTAAVIMLPYLSREELKPVWSEFEKPACSARMSDMEKQYLVLFKAMGARDFNRVSAIACDLLAHDATLPQNIRTYLVGIGMLSFIANGNRAESLRLYQKMYDTAEHPDIIFRLLYAQSIL
jgi:hypothetical protein